MAPSPLPEMSWGKADAPVTIVQYASMTCPHCRNFHKVTYPELKRRFIDTGKVRYILREFPIGKTSGNATIALRCAPPDKYLELYGKFMEQQPQWVSLEVRPDAIFAVARQVGMTRAQFDACLQNQGMIENLKWVKDRGRKLGIVGTPNFFIGDKLIKKELTIAEIADYVEQGSSRPRRQVRSAALATVLSHQEQASRTSTRHENHAAQTFGVQILRRSDRTRHRAGTDGGRRSERLR